MSATSAPEAEQRDPLSHEDFDGIAIDQHHAPHDVAPSTSPERPDEPRAKPSTRIKSEETSEMADTSTPSTLRPTPQPSAKRRASEAASSTLDAVDMPNKKRKRVPSPPWQFPTADTATLKTSDGRRASARVHTGTPGLSESEGRGRSVSVSQSTGRSRPPSPPWKKFQAEGPTSIHVDGKRKSGRVNKELADTPKRISPRSKKQPNRLSGANLAPPKNVPVKSAGASRRKVDEDEDHTERHAARPSSASANNKIAELQAKIAALQPTRSLTSPTNDRPPSGHTRRNSHALKIERENSVSPNRRRSTRPSNAHDAASRPSPKIKLRNSGPRRVVPPPHPQARATSPARPPQLSLHQIIEKYELEEMQQPYLESDRGPPEADYFAQRARKQGAEEGLMRQHILQQAKQGGALSKERLSLYQDERQREPPSQYGHRDHLVAHALYLRQLQVREKTQHRALAKKLAYEALEYYRALYGPTEEDLQAEQDKTLDLIKKQLVADLKAKWEMVEAHVQAVKRARYEREQEEKRAEKLRKKLEYSETLLARQRGDLESDSELHDLSDHGMSDTSNDEDEDHEDGSQSLSENMSESDSDAEEDGTNPEMDEDELAAYLAQRQAEPPDEPATDGDDDSDDDSGCEHADEDMDEDADGEEGECEDEDEQDQTSPDRVHPMDTSGLSKAGSPRPSGDDDEENLGIPQTTSDAPDHDANLPDNDHKPCQSSLPAGRRSGRRSPSAGPTEAEVEVEEHLSSDESTDMDSEDYDSDEDMSSTGDEDMRESEQGADDDSDEEETRVGSSLLGFYSSKDFLRERDGGLPTPVTSVENGGDNARSTSEPRSDGHIQASAGGDVPGPSGDEPRGPEELELPQERTPTSNAVAGSTLGAEDGRVSETHEVPLGPNSAGPEEPSKRDTVPQPALLRGTLRSYQHAGLDWLASLYRNGTNGILADEMGLGKTIQTISLLAHLAEVHEVWEPHLVIVPTSVILNWVTEFQKFLPGFRVLGYYGTAEERLAKRRGWVHDPHHEDKSQRGYNVVITSYTIAMSDFLSLRAAQWHYVILDEAHNIRNYNSKKWQTLIRIRSRARLLLTGTPLQNNLAELWALLTFLTAGDDDRSHGELEEFMSHWKDPVNEIFNQGVEKISEDSQKVVNQLHISLRPFLLRRKKIEVEKDLPIKIERVIVCKLSKRQRQLYQEYMGLAEIKAALARGSGIQAGAVLLSLRRVCNHPDLFDPRPIQTSFAMERSPLDAFAVKEGLIRRMLGAKDDVPARLLPAHNERARRSAVQRSRKLAASGALRKQAAELEASLSKYAPDAATISGARTLQRWQKRQRQLESLRACIKLNTSDDFSSGPVYGTDLRELVSLRRDKVLAFSVRGQQPVIKRLQVLPAIGRRSLQLEHRGDLTLIQSSRLQRDVETLDRYAERLQDTIVKFACIPPVVTVPILKYAIPAGLQTSLRSLDEYPFEEDFAHEARVRTSIAFPDRRLLIYDAGKLQRLTHLLRDLQARGSRSLIFTQMSGSLNILEQFLNLLNLPYLRLDGNTPVERRQLYASEFNRPDSKYQCMILSSRAGGVGLNLTGASSVIFYDLDWNPQMDRQCEDRAHRIGQVRDVEVYKMVSEKTVEENILRRANQKSLLDQAVIQEGQFTTEFRQAPRLPESGDVIQDSVEMAVERLFGAGEKEATKTLEAVEDRDDVLAARQARKEDQQDEVDFAELSSRNLSKANTPGPGGAAHVDEEALGVDERHGHVDYYMIRQMEALLKHVQYVPPPVRRLDKHGRDPSHRPKRKR